MNTYINIYVCVYTYIIDVKRSDPCYYKAVPCCVYTCTVLSRAYVYSFQTEEQIWGLSALWGPSKRSPETA